MEVVSHSTGRNPIITGKSGIGKTSIIHELVRRIESGHTLLELKGQQVRSNHRVPNLLIDPALPLELQDLETRFRNAVLGQEEAINAMVQMISLIKSGLSDMCRPFGAFLFVGPTGVGKTHLAQFLAYDRQCRCRSVPWANHWV